jgi:hypothetical protein
LEKKVIDGTHCTFARDVKRLRYHTARNITKYYEVRFSQIAGTLTTLDGVFTE